MCETKCEAKSEAISGPRLAWRLRPGYTRECIAHFPFGSYAIRESSWERDRMVLFMSWARSPVREEGHRGGNVEAAIDALKAWAQADFARRLEVSLGEVQHNAGCSINYTPSKFNPTPTCNCGATHMTDPTLTPEVYGPDHANPQGLARAKAAMEDADKARIEAENTALSKARTYIGFASDHLHLARFDASNRALMRSMAIDNLCTACAALGYDLVKRDD